MFTITPPGGSFTDFDRWQWNLSCWERFARLRDLAGKQASREVPAVTSRLIAWVPELQDRGLLHFHLVFEGSNLLEKRWAERYCRYLRRNVERHGFGPLSKRGAWGREDVGRYVGKLAKYLSKGSSLQSMWEAGEVPGRPFYVARALTDQTGCTMRRLRLVSRVWASERLSIPVAALAEWAEWERVLERPLERSWLADLHGVSRRGPPPSVPSYAPAAA